MKKLILLISIMLLMASFAYAVEWFDTDKTVEWEPTTKLINDGAIPETDVVRYNVYMRKGNNEETFLIETSGTEYAFSLVQEGRYLIGISTVRYVDLDEDGEIDIEGGDIKLESQISWSNAGGEISPDPFGFALFFAPTQPRGIKVK